MVSLASVQTNFTNPHQPKRRWEKNSTHVAECYRANFVKLSPSPRLHLQVVDCLVFTEVNSLGVVKAAGLKWSPIISGGLNANKTQTMTTLTSVKCTAQQEILDMRHRTIYRGKSNVAPVPQLGHAMPVGLPFWLGVSKPFNVVEKKKKLKRKKNSGVSFHIFLSYKATWQQWFNTSLQWGNEPLHCMSEA